MKTLKILAVALLCSMGFAYTVDKTRYKDYQELETAFAKLETLRQRLESPHFQKFIDYLHSDRLPEDKANLASDVASYLRSSYEMIKEGWVQGWSDTNDDEFLLGLEYHLVYWPHHYRRTMQKVLKDHAWLNPLQLEWLKIHHKLLLDARDLLKSFRRKNKNRLQIEGFAERFLRLCPHVKAKSNDELEISIKLLKAVRDDFNAPKFQSFIDRLFYGETWRQSQAQLNKLGNSLLKLKEGVQDELELIEAYQVTGGGDKCAEDELELLDIDVLSLELLDIDVLSLERSAKSAVVQSLNDLGTARQVFDKEVQWIQADLKLLEVSTTLRNKAHHLLLEEFKKDHSKQ